MVKIIISQFFKIEGSQSDFEFVDLNIDGDTRLYVDPYLLHHSPQIGKIAEDKIFKFFSKIINYHLSGNESEMRRLFRNSQENNALHIGMSRGVSKGTGDSEEGLLNEINYLLNKLPDNESYRTFKIFSGLPYLTVPRFGADHCSDLIVSLILKELIDFTIQQAKKYNIPMISNYDYGKIWNGTAWIDYKAPCIIDNKNKPLILIPKTIVSKRYGYSAEGFVRDILHKLQDESGEKRVIEDLRKELVGGIGSKTFINQEIDNNSKETYTSLFKYTNDKYNEAKPMTDEELTKIVN